MKESKWFSAVVFTVLLGVNGLSFFVLQWQKVSHNRVIAAMGILVLFSVTYIVLISRSRMKTRRSRIDK